MCLEGVSPPHPKLLPAHVPEAGGGQGPPSISCPSLPASPHPSRLLEPTEEPLGNCSPPPHHLQGTRVRDPFTSSTHSPPPAGSPLGPGRVTEIPVGMGPGDAGVAVVQAGAVAVVQAAAWPRPRGHTAVGSRPAPLSARSPLLPSRVLDRRPHHHTARAAPTHGWDSVHPGGEGLGKLRQGHNASSPSPAAAPALPTAQGGGTVPQKSSFCSRVLSSTACAPV